MSSHFFRHHPGADSARAHVRHEQHTLISMFKLSHVSVCQLKHLRARGRKLVCTVRRFVRALMRSTQTRASDSEHAEILSSLKFCLNGQINSKIVKMPILVSIL